MSISIQYSISETVTKVKYCNLDSCYFLFQNDLRFICIKQTLYFTWHQDLGLDPKPIQVKLEYLDFNGICARPMSPCKSDFSPIHTRNLFQWILSIFSPLHGGWIWRRVAGNGILGLIEFKSSLKGIVTLILF